MKVCGSCLQEKNISEFSFRKDTNEYRNSCILCQSTYHREYHKNWYFRNKKERSQQIKKYYLENIDSVKKYTKNWKKENRSRLRILEKKRIESSINVKLTVKLRQRLNKAIRGNQKTGSAVKDLGCSISYLKLWIEQQFQDGMTWQNYGKGEGKWNIDHIIPLSKFDLADRKQFLKACHWFNLRPLWEKENQSRGNRTNE